MSNMHDKWVMVSKLVQMLDTLVCKADWRRRTNVGLYIRRLRGDEI